VNEDALAHGVLSRHKQTNKQRNKQANKRKNTESIEEKQPV
jgi:hypothetical protein